jgi:hypothetical protein
MRFSPGRFGHVPGRVQDCRRLKPRLRVPNKTGGCPAPAGETPTLRVAPPFRVARRQQLHHRPLWRWRVLLGTLRAFGHKARLRELGRISAALSGRLRCVVLLLLWSVMAGCGSAPVGYQPPKGWQAIPLPTTQLSAQYAISPDVPGLIVGCVGDRLGGPANLWSTSDGGAHWRQSPFDGLLGGCDLAAPVGGQGAIFVLNILGANAEQRTLKVSRDAGQTWQTVATSADFQSAAIPDGDWILQDLFGLVSSGVYRDGRLYTGSWLDVTDMDFFAVPAFSVSDDDGRTWTRLESGTDPLAARDYMPLGIAPDYRSPDAWFRMLGPNEQGQPAPAMLEHSSDGGHTWTVIGFVGPAGTFGAAGMATLATTPTQPSRLCAGIVTEVAEQNTSAQTAPPFAPAATFGPPPTPPQDIALAGSDDGGLTWSSATIVQQSHTDYPASGVFVNSSGTCFLAENYTVFGDSDPDVARIWQLAPGAGAQPELFRQVQHQMFMAFVVNSGSSQQHPRFVAITATYHQHTTPDGYAISATEPSRLIWTDAP